MGLVDWLISPRATSALNDNDFWYTPIGELAGTESGVAVGPHTALQSSAVWACVNLISQTIASLPCILYERIGETDRRRAVDKNLYWLLHDTPNDVQTPIEFFQMQVAHLLPRGNAYAFIVPGGPGFASQLIPLG